jgi:hypothetical protein
MQKLLQGGMSALTAVPGHRLVAYEEMAAAASKGRLRAKVTFHLHSGEQLVIKSTSATQELGDGWRALGSAASMLTPTSSR